MPGATTTNTEMITKRLDSIGRVTSELNRKTFSPIFFVFGQLNIQPVTWDAVFNKDDLTLTFANGLATGGIIKGEYVFYNDFRAFFSHVAKIVDDYPKPTPDGKLFC